MPIINGDHQVPAYTPKPGGIGDKIYRWLINLPFIGDYLQRLFEHEQQLQNLAWGKDRDQLIFFGLMSDGAVRQEALAELEKTYPGAMETLTGVGSWLREAMDNPSAKIGDTLRAGFSHPLAVELAESVGAILFDSIMNMAIGGAEKLSPDLQERIRRFLGTVVLMTSAPKVAGAVAEIASLGQIDTLGDVFRDAYFNLGLGFVTWQMTSPLIDGGIGQSLRNEANFIFRPQRFTWAQIRDLYSLGRLSYDEIRDELRRLGWREEDIDHIVALAYKSLSDATVLGMWSEELLDDTETLARLRESGYTYKDAALIMDYTRLTKLNAQRDVLLSTARKAFQNGLIAEDRFRTVLAGLGYSQEAIDLEVEVAKLQMQEEERNLSASQLKDAFLSNVITEAEALSGLQELGFRNDEAMTLIETWKRSREPKVLRVNKQTILQAWQRGVLTEAEARSKLSEVGYPPADVDLIIAAAKAEGAFTQPKASVGMLIEGVRSNVIAVDTLQTELRARGYADFDIMLISGVTTAIRPIETTTDNILDAFQADVIKREPAREKLIALGMSPTTADLLLDTREAEREARRPHVPLGVLMAMAAEELISVSDLRSILVDRTFPEGDIAIIVAAVLYEVPRDLSQSMIERAYSNGVVSRDEAIDRLVIIGFTPTDANTILVTVEKEMAVKQPRASVTAYVAATRDGIISVGELRLKLVRLGMSPEDVELFVALATFQPAMPDRKLSKTEVLNAYEAFFYNRIDALRRLEMLGYALEDADVLIRMVRRDPKDSEVHTLYQAGILDFDQAAVAFFALGYTEDQIMYYFEHFLRGE